MLRCFRIRIATIRDKGDRPCPRCLIDKLDIPKIGQVRDSRTRISKARTYAGDLVRQARDFIYRLGLGVKSAAVERVLKQDSWVPTLVRGHHERLILSICTYMF